MTDTKMIIAALSNVNDPELHQDIVSLNMVRDVEFNSGKLTFSMILTTPACPLRETLDQDVRSALANLSDIKEIEIDWGAEVRSTVSREGGPSAIDGVKNIIAVGSNKGGVGKSTISTNLAVALAKLGAKVGIIDADITGPNIPTMLGITEGIQSEGNVGLHPIEAHGISAASIGFVLPQGTPVVWRGPMIGSGVRQLMRDIQWEDIDYLIIDLPPGTSDASMTMAQDALIAGVVIVSSPQKVAIEDARKAVGMFDRLSVPIFGIVENMSGDIFGQGGAREAAEELGIEFLGELPLDSSVRKGSDEGVPIVVSEPNSIIADSFIGIAEQVASRCSVLQFAGEEARI